MKELLRELGGTESSNDEEAFSVTDTEYPLPASWRRRLSHAGAVGADGASTHPGAQASGRLVTFGAALYVVATVQFLACVAVAASRYGPPDYNPMTVTISDLQAVNCGVFQGAEVCSPMHSLANASVALLGLLIIAGSLTVRPAFPGSRRRDMAVGLLLVGGLATLANAFTPEDVTVIGDLVTALVAFLGANFGIIQFGRAVSVEPQWRELGLFAQALGLFGAVALALDGFGLGTVIGTGAAEWMIVAPILVWAPTTGIRVLLRTPPVEQKRRTVEA